jgi:hypothetical protein
MPEKKKTRKITKSGPWLSFSHNPRPAMRPEGSARVTANTDASPIRNQYFFIIAAMQIYSFKNFCLIFLLHATRHFD